MKISVHIGRLTVEGKSHAEGVRLGEALRSRLAELAASGALGEPQASSVSNIDRMDAGQLPAGASPVQTGQHLAGRIFQNLKGPTHG